MNNKKITMSHSQARYAAGRTFDKIRPPMEAKIARKEFSFVDKGSITIEASLAFSFFAIILGALISLFIVLNRQVNVLYKMDRIAYAAAAAEYVAGDDSSLKNLDIEILGSAVKTENDEVCIGVTYVDGAEFLPFSIGKMIISQQVCRRAWTGRSIAEDENESAAEEYVYVTEGGTVYHTTESCPYLNPLVYETTSEEVGRLRSKDGSRYYPCPFCGGGSGTVYITSYGTSYHASRDCSQLHRAYSEKLLSEVSLPACSKCGGSHE